MLGGQTLGLKVAGHGNLPLPCPMELAGSGLLSVVALGRALLPWCAFIAVGRRSARGVSIGPTCRLLLRRGGLAPAPCPGANLLEALFISIASRCPPRGCCRGPARAGCRNIGASSRTCCLQRCSQTTAVAVAGCGFRTRRHACPRDAKGRGPEFVPGRRASVACARHATSSPQQRARPASSDGSTGASTAASARVGRRAAAAPPLATSRRPRAVALKARAAPCKVRREATGLAGPVAWLGLPRRACTAIAAPGSLAATPTTLHAWLPPLLARLRAAVPAAARPIIASVGLGLIQPGQKIPQATPNGEGTVPPAASAAAAAAASLRHGRCRAAAPAVVRRQAATRRVECNQRAGRLPKAPRSPVPGLLAARRRAERGQAGAATGRRQSARRQRRSRRRAATHRRKPAAAAPQRGARGDARRAAEGGDNGERASALCGGGQQKAGASRCSRTTDAMSAESRTRHHG